MRENVSVQICPAYSVICTYLCMARHLKCQHQLLIHIVRLKVDNIKYRWPNQGFNILYDTMTKRELVSGSICIMYLTSTHLMAPFMGEIAQWIFNINISCDICCHFPITTILPNLDNQIKGWKALKCCFGHFTIVCLTATQCERSFERWIVLYWPDIHILIQIKHFENLNWIFPMLFYACSIGLLFSL